MTAIFRIDARIRNNRLVALREQNHPTTRDAAASLGLSYPTLLEYETLKKSPWDRHGGWKPSALKVAEAFGALPEELWPEAVRAVRKVETRLFMDALPDAELPADPETLLLEADDSIFALKSLKQLTPREEQVVRRRFGLRGQERAETLEEIADTYGIDRERVRTIEQKALVKLREQFRLHRGNEWTWRT